MNPHKFQSWFENYLTVGCIPHKASDFCAANYRYIINVSDEYYPERVSDRREYFWFPMSEQKRDMGLNSIYGAIYILSLAEANRDSVYLHCHSGNNRSWTVACAYYFFRTGEHLIRPVKSGPHENKLLANCARAYLPPRAEMEALLIEFRNDLSTGMKPGVLTMAKIKAIKNF